MPQMSPMNWTMLSTTCFVMIKLTKMITEKMGSKNTLSTHNKSMKTTKKWTW